MNWLHTAVIAVGLGMDALAVSMTVGVTIERLTRGHVFRLAFHFTLFQFMMTVAGWLAGRSVAEYIAAWDHWIVFALLAGVGSKMLWEARPGRKPKPRSDPTRGLSLVILSVATSIDALAVGLTMALLGVSVWVPAFVIGITAGLMTLVGICFSGRFGPRAGRRAEVLGGLVLIGIGVHVLARHFLGRV